MTTEQEPQGRDVVSYVQFGVPHVPFSAVRVPATEEWIVEGVRLAALLVDQYQAMFALDPQPTPPPQEAPQPRQEARSAPPPAQAGNGAERLCATHMVPVRKSKFHDEKFYHDLPEEQWYRDREGKTVQRCTVWLSQTTTANATSAPTGR